MKSKFVCELRLTINNEHERNCAATCMFADKTERGEK